MRGNEECPTLAIIQGKADTKKGTLVKKVEELSLKYWKMNIFWVIALIGIAIINIATEHSIQFWDF